MRYGGPMNDVSVRELRNNTSGVLRTVEAGETVRVTVDRRPVAELVPLRRAAWVAGDRLGRHCAAVRRTRSCGMNLRRCSR